MAVFGFERWRSTMFSCEWSARTKFVVLLFWALMLLKVAGSWFDIWLDLI